QHAQPQAVKLPEAYRPGYDQRLQGTVPEIILSQSEPSVLICSPAVDQGLDLYQVLLSFFPDSGITITSQAKPKKNQSMEIDVSMKFSGGIIEIINKIKGTINFTVPQK
ncbi:MAG: hypothetical protein M1148_02275, partial [Candidatus Thermoplasmatota archaeon]|nr:hypothetical protein [Candidatus Thermoplasmatota archaeon]